MREGGSGGGRGVRQSADPLIHSFPPPLSLPPRSLYLLSFARVFLFRWTAPLHQQTFALFAQELARLKRIEALVEKKEQAMRRQWAAAEHIQRWWRRRRFRRLCTIALLWERGSIVIQQHCRGALDTLRAARIRVGREVDRRRRAAVAIQRAWREHRKRVEAAELAAYHGRIQREKALAAAREAATRRIQRIWRGCVARARVHAMQARRHRAAKVIQRWIRQVHFREIILARVEAKFTLHRVQQRAAVRIQKVFGCGASLSLSTISRTVGVQPDRDNPWSRGTHRLRPDHSPHSTARMGRSFEGAGGVLGPPKGRGAWEGGEPRPPLQGAPHMPICPPDAKCRLPWHLSPRVTAPNRFGFGNLLQPPI